LLDRTQKLKDARSEAAKEIESYKAKKEEEFKQYEKEVSFHFHFHPFQSSPSCFHLTRLQGGVWEGREKGYMRSLFCGRMGSRVACPLR